MQLRIKNSDVLRELANKYFLLVFGVFFCTSWLYVVIAFGFDSRSIIIPIKYIILLGFSLLMIVTIRWGEINFDLFSICSAIWLVLCGVSWAAHGGDSILYVKRIGQIAFAFLFVTYLWQNPEKNPCAHKALMKWFSPLIFNIVVILIIVLGAAHFLAEDILEGFGNSRVNFSIWLMQISALIFLLDPPMNVRSNLLRAFGMLLLITPTYILQNMTGGRSGMLGTVMLAAYFSYKRDGIKALIFSIIWAYLISLLVRYYNPLITPENNLNVFRNSAPFNFVAGSGYLGWLNDMLVWLDKLSSYRISILVTAFSSLDMKGYIWGVGIGNFMGWAPTYPELGMVEVHNVFLKVLGEFGIFGFVIFLLLVVPPVTRRGGAEKSAVRYLQLVYIAVAMVHPDLLMTAINTSIVYLSCFAASLGTASLKNKEKNLSLI